LVHLVRRNVLRDTGWHDDRTRWRLSRDCARRAANASHGNGNRDSSRFGPYPPRLKPAADDSGVRLDTERTVQSTLRRGRVRCDNAALFTSRMSRNASTGGHDVGRRPCSRHGPAGHCDRLRPIVMAFASDHQGSPILVVDRHVVDGTHPR
jgi:hypothetical protein